MAKGDDPETTRSAKARRAVAYFAKQAAQRSPDGFAEGRTYASDVKVEPVRWLFPGWIPRGALTLLEGEPDNGKSTLTLDLAARVSTGAVMPGCDPSRKPQSAGVVLLVAEDTVNTTIVPRLKAAGADMRRIIIREWVRGEHGEKRPATLDDIATLRADIVDVEAALVVIDPIVAFIDGSTSIYNDQQVRQALAPLVALGQEQDAAVLGVRHLRKGASGNPIHAGGGSIAFSAAARSVLLLARNPDDTREGSRILARTKCNLAPPVASRTLSLVSRGDVACIEWEGESKHTAHSLLASVERATTDRRSDGARAFVAKALDGGPVAGTSVLQEAERYGLSDKRVRAAAAQLGVEQRREGFGKGSTVFWELPSENDHTSPYFADSEVGKYGEL